MFLNQNFIFKNMLLAPDFYVFVMYFCVFNGESTEVGYRSLTE